MNAFIIAWLASYFAKPIAQGTANTISAYSDIENAIKKYKYVFYILVAYLLYRMFKK
jgi:hypothetical protein